MTLNTYRYMTFIQYSSTSITVSFLGHLKTAIWKYRARVGDNKKGLIPSLEGEAS